MNTSPHLENPLFPLAWAISIRLSRKLTFVVVSFLSPFEENTFEEVENIITSRSIISM